jgi:hypothetical protein
LGYVNNKLKLNPKQNAFLAAYAESGNISLAAKAAKVARRSHYEWMTNPQYAAAFASAKEQACEYLESIAWQRATRADKPSDVLLIFLMKGSMPDKYRDNVRLEHSGELAVITERLAAARARLKDAAD